MSEWKFFFEKWVFCSPSRDFSPNLKQDLSGLSNFFRQLRSKSCFKMSGLSGFWTVYLKKPLKNRASVSYKIRNSLYCISNLVNISTLCISIRSQLFSMQYVAVVYLRHITHICRLFPRHIWKVSYNLMTYNLTPYFLTLSHFTTKQFKSTTI